MSTRVFPPPAERMSPDDRPIAVVALGGNALLPRESKPDAGDQLLAARAAAKRIAGAIGDYRLVVTHGNGPQVGLLALMNDAYPDVDPYPLDVLDAESEGQIGYVIEMEIDNATERCDTVALITRVVVDPDDEAFGCPTKFIGPLYGESEALGVAAERGWSVKPDGEGWRRVVASPEPKSIVQLPAIRQLVETGFLVVCAGGGGVPVVAEGTGHRGIEAVIDKDLCSALLAAELGAELLVLATDVGAVYENWGSPDRKPIRETTPEALRRHDFAAGSMGPKVEAACRMVESTRGQAAIGRLDELDRLLAGTAGTQVRDKRIAAGSQEEDKV